MLGLASLLQAAESRPVSAWMLSAVLVMQSLCPACPAWQLLMPCCGGL